MLSYSKFDVEAFKGEFTNMTNFRRNAYGENMEALFTSLQDSYIPNQNPSRLRETYSVSSDGEIIPDKLFLNKDDDTLTFKEPLVGIKVHTGLSILTQRTPDAVWSSDNTYYDRFVPVLNELRKSDWDDQETRQQYMLMWFYFLMFGTTFWRRYYSHKERTVKFPSSIDELTKDISYDKRKVIDQSQTVGRAYSPLEVLIDPNTRPGSPSSMRKCIYTEYFTEEAFRAEFKGKVSKRKLKKVKPQLQPTPNRSRKTADQQQKIRVDYYENMDLDLYYVIANKEEELIKSPLPNTHKHLSLMMASWMPRNDKNPYGIGPVEMMQEDKRAIDEFKSMTLTQVKFSIYKALFYQGSLSIEGQDGSDIRIRPDRAYKVSNPKDLTFYNAPGPGNDAWRAMQELRARTDDASGINKPLGGEITKATAYETDLAKDAALARLSVPINNMVTLLSFDAERTLKLQEQYYSQPEIRDIVDPDDMIKAAETIDFFKQLEIPTPFDLRIEVLPGNEEPSVLLSRRRTAQLNLAVNDQGDFAESAERNEVILTEEIFQWKGKVRIVADSLLTIMPHIERAKKMELYNILIPMFSQPPELVAKVAMRLTKEYGEDYRDYFPENWLQYIDQLNAGLLTRPDAAAQANAAIAQANTNGQEPGGPMTFEQERAPGVVTNIQGASQSIASRSQTINQTV